MTHKVKHIYACDKCGDLAEFASPHDFFEIHIETNPNVLNLHLNFCSSECRDEWLKEHGLEVK